MGAIKQQMIREMELVSREEISRLQRDAVKEWEWEEACRLEEANLLICTPFDDTTFIVEDGSYLIGKPLFINPNI